MRFKKWLIWLAIFIFSLPVNTAALGADEEDTIFRLPMAEVQEVAIQWMEQNGFQVYRYPSSLGPRLELTAEKGTIGFELILNPQSPLATRAHFQSRSNQATDYIAALKTHLSGYLNSPNTHSNPKNDPIPAHVRAFQNSVVCIYAQDVEGDFQLTGFVLDRKGLIICTAHDLKAGHEVRVIGWEGRELNGRVVRIDWKRDLAMIRTDEPFSNAVSLQNGRYLLQNGDALFAVTCPNNGDSGIQPGILDGPPRRVQGLPLWQVLMHIEHGSSGSPVFDDQGRLAAIVKGRYRGTDSVGFLIPFETLLHFLGKF